MTLRPQIPDILVRASKERPVLTVISNLGAAGSPDVVIGSDPLTMLTTGIHISPASASPQITVTEVLWGMSADATATQAAGVNTQNLR